LIYVAGSGPSGKGHRFAHVVTKKKLGWDYEHIVMPRGNWDQPRTAGRAIVWQKYPHRKRWEKYYAGFSSGKMSNGMMAVFVAVDIYEPDEITLIGFDWVLDAAPSTQHKWGAEKRCIESLVRIIRAEPKGT
jgi:hypothetical protein